MQQRKLCFHSNFKSPLRRAFLRLDLSNEVYESWCQSYNCYMGKFRDRTCTTCGAVEYNTATKSEVCIKCYAESKAKAQTLKDRGVLESLGYIDISVLRINKHGKREWQFTHECGTTQTWVFGNILKRLKEDPMSVPCSRCGGIRRTKNATKVSSENNKIKNPVGWIEFKDVVRRITENNYKLYKEEINPLNLPRGMWSNHLDHIQSIAEGWELGHTPEFVARKENLQMLPAKDNLSKGRK